MLTIVPKILTFSPSNSSSAPVSIQPDSFAKRTSPLADLKLIDSMFWLTTPSLSLPNVELIVRLSFALISILPPASIVFIKLVANVSKLVPADIFISFCADKLPFISSDPVELIKISAPLPFAIKSPKSTALSPSLNSRLPLFVSIVPPTPK